MKAPPFRARAAAALSDDTLQEALARAHGGFVRKRNAAIEAFPEFEALREAGRAIKAHTLSYLDFYLERYEANVLARGGRVHWARTALEACDIITGICQEADAKRVIKGKSMVGEEISLNRALEAAGLAVTETDLGEYIIQLAGETPSHIIAPAVHKTRDQVARLFRAHHPRYGLPSEERPTIPDLVNEARRVLREKFLNADAGITGANFLVAETGSNILVTNEGNGDLTSTLPRVHIVLSGIEKVVPTLADATTLLRLLGRSATGQEMASYTTLFTGPRRPADTDGPEEYHVVLMDNGRSEILGTPYREILHCIRCGACLNYCPVYGAIGGHAYGWVYPGPMGAVLTPLLLGPGKAPDLPQACTLNGRCETVCPLKIPLPDLIRRLRGDAWERKETPRMARWFARGWAFFAKRPRYYAGLTALGARVLGALGGRRGRIRSAPFLGRWTGSRDLPAPPTETFQAQWRRHEQQHRREEP
uniref:L-lactate dehydrogenase complex protein LldF n=1 Tax=Candidatus Kentrum eta TaxID=2126337 RepID=A0A450VGC0_9GAMM|nr:MAG: L-lactate dehydrogenase complex protein LldF [Candidatus Kentron sp. H]VFK03834.1 MAG: L-lactate dehydrogenase complex protein LldF [Candidatus Kentron sp. H]VFK06552.1 MAG: L-lactate dehydrogenase complex protein LldF [Candidatus Kentron sp. H]